MNEHLWVGDVEVAAALEHLGEQKQQQLVTGMLHVWMSLWGTVHEEKEQRQMAEERVTES